MANTNWTMDPAHSEIEFKVRHMMISNVKGTFNSFDTKAENEDLLQSPITVNIDTESISTNNTDRDNHLKSEDFFHVAQYPKITFKSKRMEHVSGNEYKLYGDLTIKDKTNEVALDVEYNGTNTDPWGNQKAGFAVSGKINRKNWGLNWNAALEAGGVMVSDEVKIEADVQFTKQ